MVGQDSTGFFYEFILQRLENYLVKTLHYDVNCVRSVLANKPTEFNYLISLLDSLTTFANNPENKLILAANKRIENILVKTKLNKLVTFDAIQGTNSEEITLMKLYNESLPLLTKYNQDGNWGEYFNTLSKFNQPINCFFDKVMVMDEDIDIRINRLNLLTYLHKLFNKTCKLSELA